MSESARTSASEEGIWSPRYRSLTIGLILSVTLVAFLWLGVATVLPSVAGELDGLGLFGWAFTAFMLANIFGTVLAGQGRTGRVRPVPTSGHSSISSSAVRSPPSRPTGMCSCWAGRFREPVSVACWPLPI